MSSLTESSVLIDRALVTLCAELPESLGLYDTGKDQLSIGALRSVPLLERLQFESRKHFVLRDWMRSYVPGEDQALTAEISFDSMRETLKRERKERQRLERLEETAAAANGKGKDKKKKREKEKEARAADKAKVKKASKTSAGSGRSGKVKAKGKSKQRLRRQRQGDSDDEGEFVVSDGEVSMGSLSSSSGNSSSSSESESSEEETKESEQRDKSASSARKKRKHKQKQKKVKSNLPLLEVVLSSDEEDEEANEMFDEGDPDVYEVETVLDKRPGPVAGEPEYLIKWVGYEETTWEPAANVSKDLVDEFEGQPVRENEYAVEEIRDRRAKRDPETCLKTHEYLVKWVGYDETTWEPAENLPHNLRRRFDSKYEARKRRRR